MRIRQLDAVIPAAPKAARGQQRWPAEAQGAIAARQRPVRGPVSGAGQLDLAAQATVLRQATGGRLARAGHVLVQLQRERGNRYVQGLLSRAQQPPPQLATRGQPLVVAPAGAEQERQADRMADLVTRQAARPGPSRRATPAVAPVTMDGSARATGRPLPDPVRAGFEAAFGADFGRVRVHADGGAASLSSDLGAQAFTRGCDVYFGAGRYAPATAAGRRLLAHELAHVVQQGRAPAIIPAGAELSTSAAAVPLQAASVPAGIIQRKLDWRHTEWEEARAAWSSADGAGGVVFVTDSRRPRQRRDVPVIVKPPPPEGGNALAAETVLAANLAAHLQLGARPWQVGAPGARGIGPNEGARIVARVSPLFPPEDRGQEIVARADQPGTIVFQSAAGKEYSKLLQDYLQAGRSHSESSSRQIRRASPLRFFQDAGFAEALGRIAALDIFLGNMDRLTTYFNPDNFMVAADAGRIHLIDNAAMNERSIFRSVAGRPSEQSFQNWTQYQWTAQLRAGSFAEMADAMLAAAEGDMLGRIGNLDVDQALFREVLAGAREHLIRGLEQGKNELRIIFYREQALSEGVVEEDRPEVRRSVIRRCAFLFPDLAEEAEHRLRLLAPPAPWVM